MRSHVLSGLFVLSQAATLMGALHEFSFTMNQAQAFPPTGSPGVGCCSVVLDDVLNTMDVTCTFDELLGFSTAAHLHGPAPAGSNAGVLVTLQATLGQHSGTISAMDRPLTPTQVQYMLNGTTYIDVHSSAYPGGELRGQVVDGIVDDCNNNGAGDACDIAAGTSTDCQPNGIPDECDGGCVQSLVVVDPNPAHRAMAALVTDPARLAVGGRAISGLAADGVTPVLIRYTGFGPGTVTITATDDASSTHPDNVGVLNDARGLAAPGNPLTLPLVLVNNQWMAFAILTSPLDFVRGSADEALGQQNPRTIFLSAVFTPAGGGGPHQTNRGLFLVRPPVMLIHGVWSEGAMWRWPQFIPGDGRFFVWSQDYQGTHAARFMTNVVVPRIGVANAVRRLRARGFAVTQADVIGHSMGGILSRMYVSGANFIRDDNFRKGDIHKLITLDSPHKGSELADLLDVLGLTDPGNVVTEWAAEQMTEAGFCTNCGAVDDLQVDSAEITNLPAADVPVHAIAGTGGSDLVAHGIVATLPPKIRIIFEVLDLLGWPPSRIFAEAGIPQHDLIVGFVSQQGGLSGPELSFIGEQWNYSVLGSIHFGLPPALDPSGTVGVPVNPDVGTEAVRLLNRKTGSTSFAAGFPAAPFRRTLGQIERPVLQLATGGLVITSPAPGTVVTAGGQVTVAVQPTGGFIPEAILIATPGDAMITSNGPFEVALTVAPDAVGPMAIRAMARNAGDEFAVADDVIVNVTFSAALTGITAVPDELTLFSYAPTGHLHVLGQYDDGVDRDLTAGSSGTGYISSNGAIVSVSDDGQVTAVGLGQTAVLISHGGLQDQVIVTVESIRNDYDSDGDVDLVDYGQFAACLTGPHEGTGFSMPSLECRDIFDNETDTDVDLPDLARFQAEFAG